MKWQHCRHCKFVKLLSNSNARYLEGSISRCTLRITNIGKFSLSSGRDTFISVYEILFVLGKIYFLLNIWRRKLYFLFFKYRHYLISYLTRALKILFVVNTCLLAWNRKVYIHTHYKDMWISNSTFEYSFNPVKRSHFT